jgi:VWFA-related protein
MKRVALVFATLGVSTIVLGQQAAAPSQSGPLFRTGIEYVSVDVVVTDKNDRPVEGLTKDDFIISENGKAQAIKDFQFVSIPRVARTVEVTRPGPPPDVATNKPPSPKSRLFAIVIDDLHVIEQILVPLKAMLADLINAMAPDDEVAVVFAGRSDMGVNFTTDRAAVMKPIEGLKAALGFGDDAFGAPGPSDIGISGGGKGGTASGSLQPGRTAKTGETLNHARSSAMTLQSVTASLAGSGHARRAIFFVSGGFPISYDPNDFWYQTVRGELDIVYANAKKADVPIYTIDPRGLISSANSVRGWPPPEPAVLAAVKNQQNYLAEIADNTGGRALMNRSDLKSAVEEIVQENGSYYLLGYSPDPLVRDGKFHDISVKVNRPGLIVRPRKGYVAPSSKPETTDAKPVLDKAMSAGVNVAGLALRAVASPMAASPNGMTTVVTVQLTYPAPSDGSTQMADEFEMSVIALDPDAKVKASSARKVHFSSSVVDGAATVTLLVNDAIVLPSQPLTLRIGMASQALGRAGTIQLPISVPKPADSKLQFGGVVLGFADFGREASLQRELLNGLVPFQPTTTRAFAATDTLRVFSRLFWGSKDEAADVTITIAGAGGRAPQSVHVPGAPSTANPSRREGTVTTTVPMKDLAAGAHVLHLEARLSGGQAVTKDIPFEVK